MGLCEKHIFFKKKLMQIFFCYILVGWDRAKIFWKTKQNRRELVAQGINILDFQSSENENNRQILFIIYIYCINLIFREKVQILVYWK